MEKPPQKEASLDQYRTIFAAERTLLSWTRTNLAMMGLGFILARFGLFLREVNIARHEVPDNGQTPVWLGMSLVIMGTVVQIIAAHRHRQIQKRVAAGTELAQTGMIRTPILLSIGLSFFGVGLGYYLLRVGISG